MKWAIIASVEGERPAAGGRRTKHIARRRRRRSNNDVRLQL